jgi:hypothetical protein
MANDYLILNDDRKVRVEWNMNALGMFTMLTGKNLGDLASVGNDYNTLRSIAYCSVIEGERIEGRELNLTEVEFGSLMSMFCIARFSEMLTEHILRGAQKKNPAKGRTPQVITRKS